MPHPRRTEPTRARRLRRRFWVALGAAALVHALVLWLLVLPSPTHRPTTPELVVTPETVLVQPPAEADTRVEDAERPGAEPSRPAPARRAEEEPAPASVPVPRAATGPPDAETIPETALTRLQAPTLPLEATPFGVTRRRVARDPARIARMRAESLLAARVGTTIETEPPLSAGPVSLANGGVTIAVPWGGFIRSDRTDEAWRAERCRKKGDRKADEPGEEEARRAQCG